MPGLASPAKPRRSASAASSRIALRFVGVPITDKAGRAGIAGVSVIAATVHPGSVRDRGRIGDGGRRASTAAPIVAGRDDLPVQPVGSRWGASPGDGLVARAAQDGHRGPCSRSVRWPPAGHVRDAARQQPADDGQRLDGATGSRRVLFAAHDEGARRRAVRCAAPPRALHPWPVPDGDVAAPSARGRHISRRGRERQLQVPPFVDQAGCQEHRPRRRGLEGRRRAGEAVHRRQLRDPLQRRRDRCLPRRPSAPDDRTDDLLLRTPRGTQGARRPPRGRAGARSGSAGVGRQHRPRYGASSGGVRDRPSNRMARPPHRRGQDGEAEGCRRVLCPVAARRVVRRRA